MLPCSDCEAMMPDALTGRLDAESVARLQAHVKACAVCAGVWREMSETAALLEEAVAVAPSSKHQKLWQRIASTLESEKSAAIAESTKKIVSARFTPAVDQRGIGWAVAAMVAVAVLMFASYKPLPSFNRDGAGARVANAGEVRPAPRPAIPLNPLFNDVETTTGPVAVKTSEPAEPETKTAVALVQAPADPVVAAVAVVEERASEAAVANPAEALARPAREAIDDATGLLLTRKTGPVAVFDARHSAWRTLVAGERVAYGATLRTGGAARAELAFGESRVRLDENTEAVIARDEKARVATLANGRLLVDLLRSPVGFRIDSAGGSVELTGTIVEVEAPAPELAIVRVLEGHVNVASRSSGNGDLLRLKVSAGEEALLAQPRPEAFNALPQALRERARELVAKSGMALPTAPGLPKWVEDLDKPRARGDAAVGQLIVKDEQGRPAEPLTVAIMDVTASIRGPQALTRVDQSFRNTTDRTLEGTFYFPLPPGAAISRFAMYVDNEQKTLIEGEVVERGKARAVYESILRAKRDPALLEWMEGNLFKARIFPIPPRSLKRVILEYTQLLPAFYDSRRYVLPLVSELTQKSPIEKLNISVTVGSGNGANLRELFSPSYLQTQVAGIGSAGGSASLRLENVKPSADFVLAFSADRGGETVSSVYAEANEDPYVLLGFQPRLDEKLLAKTKESAPRDILFISETSGARTPKDLEAQKRVMQAMFSGLSSQDRVMVAAADVGLQAFADNFSEDAGDALLLPLIERAPLGALDLETVIADAAKLFDKSARQAQRTIIFVGGGVPALGTLDAGQLAAQCGTVLKNAAVRFVAIGVGNTVEALTLSQLARASGGFYTALKAEDNLEEAAFTLGLSLQSPVIESPALAAATGRLYDIYPQRLGSLLPGQEVFLHARANDLYAAAPELALTGSLLSQPFERTLAAKMPPSLRDEPAVARFWARAKLDDLLLRTQTPDLRNTVVHLAQTWTLMSPYTSFLVLESNEDYAKYAIDREKRRSVWAEDSGVSVKGKTSKPGENFYQYAPRSSNGDTVEAEVDALKADIEELRRTLAKTPPQSAIRSTVDRALDSKFGPNATVSTRTGKVTVSGLTQVWQNAVENDADKQATPAAEAARKAYTEAQEIYRRTDYDQDGVLEYAQTLNGKSSLLERAATAGDLALIDKTFAGAEGLAGTATPKAGYVFTAFSGRETTPTSAKTGAYEGTDRERFVISNNGTIFQKDAGRYARVLEEYSRPLSAINEESGLDDSKSTLTDLPQTIQGKAGQEETKSNWASAFPFDVSNGLSKSVLGDLTVAGGPRRATEHINGGLTTAEDVFNLRRSVRSGELTPESSKQELALGSMGFKGTAEDFALQRRPSPAVNAAGEKIPTVNWTQGVPLVVSNADEKSRAVREDLALQNQRLKRLKDAGVNVDLSLPAEASEEKKLEIQTRRLERLLEQGVPTGISKLLGQDPMESQLAMPDTQVLAVRPDVGLVMLSVGSQQGAKPGYQFTIARGDNYVSKVQVEKVYFDMSSARVIPGLGKSEIRVKDRALSKGGGTENASKATRAAANAVLDGKPDPRGPTPTADVALTREQIEQLIKATPKTAETADSRLELYGKLAGLCKEFDVFRVLGEGIASFGKEGPQAEALARRVLAQVERETKPAVLDGALEFIEDGFLRARILQKRANFETDAARRLEYLERAYKESENAIEFLPEVADALIHGKQFKRAAELLQKSVRDGNASPWVWQSLRQAFAGMGDERGALRALTQDVALRPREAEPRLRLAAAFDAAGKGADAIRELKAACQFAPESADAHRQLLAMAKKHNDTATQEWALLALLGGSWRSEDGAVWDEAQRGIAELSKQYKKSGGEAKAKELEASARRAAARDVVIVMKWDTDKTDVDMHVEEKSQRVNYQSRTSWQGGVLDRDVTTGYGPETYTLRRGAPGTYRVKVHYYSGTVPTTATLKVTYHAGAPEEQSREYKVKLTKAHEEVEVFTFDLPGSPESSKSEAKESSKSEVRSSK